MESHSILKNAVIKRLKSRNITPTQQRVEIAQILFEKPQHLSAEQVLDKVNEGSAAVSKATVYNTLGLFARKALIKEVIVDPSKVFYDSNIQKHHHFYNLDTGILTDIEVAEIDLNTVPQLPLNTAIADVDVIIRVRNS
ncbi:MAG: Fur family transcriptional regulator [Gammaproteobacteria bacterium]